MQAISSDLSGLSIQQQKEVQAVKANYKNPENFLSLLSPAKFEDLYLKLWDELSAEEKFKAEVRLVTSKKAPCFNTLSRAFGCSTTRQWLMVHITQLSEYLPCEVKVTPDQLKMLAGDIISNYGGLKVTEIVLYFRLLRTGKFDTQHSTISGKRFNAPLVIKAIPRFLEYRNDIQRKLDEKRLDEEHRKQVQDAVPCPAYVREHMKNFGKHHKGEESQRSGRTAAGTAQSASSTARLIVDGMVRGNPVSR